MISMATTKDVIQHFFLTKLYSCKELPTTQEMKKQEIGCPVSYLQTSSPTSVSKGGQVCSATRLGVVFSSSAEDPRALEHTAPCVLFTEMTGLFELL